MKEWIKENIVFIVVVVLFLLFAWVGIYTTFSKKDTRKEFQTVQSSSSAKESSSEEVIQETANEKNYRAAKLKLEHPYTDSDEHQKQQVAVAFEEAIKSISQINHISEVRGTFENHLSMSQEDMIQTLTMAILVNQYHYQSSQLEVTKSENEDVVQFLIVLTKTGEDDCYFVGNFNTTVNQIQLKSYVGGNIGGSYG